MNRAFMSPDDIEMLEYMQSMAAVEDRSGALRRLGSKYNGVGDFMLKHAAFWKVQPLPRRYRPMPLGRCFFNTLRLCVKYPELRFVEGFALSQIPIHHAWAIDPQGGVIDPTWETANRMYPEAKGRSYYGIQIPVEIVIETLEDTDTPSLFYGNPRRIFESIAEIEIELLNYQLVGR